MDSLDLIGDVHGRTPLLRTLLMRLGYEESKGVFRHTKRQAVFCGDLIDRGPDSAGTLCLVRAMVEAGTALAVLGNHEFHAISYRTHDADGHALRERTGTGFAIHEATLKSFPGGEAEFDKHISWFLTLPISLDLGGLRVVHAAWHDAAVARIGGRTLKDRDFLSAVSKKGTEERAAVRILLGGHRLRLPPGITCTDVRGRTRDKFRIKWWLAAEGRTYLDLALPEPTGLPVGLAPAPDTLRGLQPYSHTAPPVFFGHYRLPLRQRQPFDNVACLDYNSEGEEILTAYRWDGENVLSGEKFLTVSINCINRRLNASCESEEVAEMNKVSTL